MKKLIFLNGAINCGKTTIGRTIANSCKNVAFVEIDDLHGFIPWMPIGDAVPLNIKNGIAVAKNFIEAGLDVFFAYPLSDEDFQFARGLIDFECEVEGITLYCELEENLKNRGSRILSGYEVDRIKWMHDNGLSKPNFSTHLDVTRSSVTEAADHIIAKLGLELRQ